MSKAPFLVLCRSTFVFLSVFDKKFVFCNRTEPVGLSLLLLIAKAGLAQLKTYL